MRPSFFVTKYLIDKGYEVYPINPGHAGKEICGRPVVGPPTLADVPVPIDMVDIFRASAAGGPASSTEVLALEPLPKVIWNAADRAPRRGSGQGRGCRHQGRHEPLPPKRSNMQGLSGEIGLERRQQQGPSPRRSPLLQERFPRASGKDRQR